MSASVRPVRARQHAAAGVTLEFMDEVVEQLVSFCHWYQVNKGKELDREALSRAAAELLQQHGAMISYHVVDHLVMASIATGRYEVLKDEGTREAADAALADLGLTARELERHWH